MTAATMATTALLLLMAITAGLGIAIVIGRLVRNLREARHNRLALPARRLLLALAGGDDDPDLRRQLVALDRASWRAVEPAAVALLGKVRGEAHTSLVEVLAQRGMADQATRDLRHRSAIRRARAAEVLGNVSRHQAIAALTVRLADRDPDVRAVAARALGRIGHPDCALPLLNSLVAHRSIPHQVVAQAVIRLGPSAQPALEASLRHRDELVRATAVEVLGILGAITATAKVEYTLCADPSLDVRVRAATALGKLGTRSALTPLLAAVEPGRAPELRAAATRALGDIGAVAATPALAVLLGDPQHSVAHNAAYALLRLGQAGRAALAEAVTAGASAGAPTPADAAGAATTAGAADALTVPADVAGVSPADEVLIRAGAYAREALAVAELEENRRMPASAPPATPVAASAARGGRAPRTQTPPVRHDTAGTAAVGG